MQTCLAHLRPRWLYIIFIPIVMGAGLASRAYREYLPTFIATYAGDTLWAWLAFIFFALLLARRNTISIALLAGMFALSIELSQFYHAPWIDAIRATTLGGLVLGYKFVWSDLICYAVGITLASGVDYALLRWIAAHKVNQNGDNV